MADARGRARDRLVGEQSEGPQGDRSLEGRAATRLVNGHLGSGLFGLGPRVKDARRRREGSIEVQQQFLSERGRIFAKSIGSGEASHECFMRRSCRQWTWRKW